MIRIQIFARISMVRLCCLSLMAEQNYGLDGMHTVSLTLEK
jgi:hypothetical protein